MYESLCQAYWTKFYQPVHHGLRAGNPEYLERIEEMLREPGNSLRRNLPEVTDNIFLTHHIEPVAGQELLWAMRRKHAPRVMDMLWAYCAVEHERDSERRCWLHQDLEVKKLEVLGYTTGQARSMLSADHYHHGTDLPFRAARWALRRWEETISCQPVRGKIKKQQWAQERLMAALRNALEADYNYSAITGRLTSRGITVDQTMGCQGDHRILRGFLEAALVAIEPLDILQEELAYERRIHGLILT